MDLNKLAELDLSDEYNNIFVIAVIRTFNKLRYEKMSESDFRKSIQMLSEDCFGDYKKYIDEMTSKLYDDGEDLEIKKCDILVNRENPNAWRLRNSTEIPLCLSAAEQIYLKSILQSRYSALFFDEDEKARLLARYEDVPEIGLEECCLYAKSDHRQADWTSQEIQNIRTLLKAVREQREIVYSNRAESGNISENAKGFPVRIEYSFMDDRFRLLLWSSDENRPDKVDIHSMYDIDVTHNRWKDAKSPQEMMKTKLAAQPIEMKLHDDNKGQSERALYAFSMYDTDIEPIEEDIYLFRVRYYDFDLPEIIDKIMTFGPRIMVLSPNDVVEQIKARLTMEL